MLRTQLLVSLCAAGICAAEPPKLILMPLQPGGQVGPDIARALTEAVAASVAKTGAFTVTSAAELATLVGLERQKQLLGCGEDASSCLAELGMAMGAPFVMSGSITQLGSSYQLSLQMLEVNRSRTVGRATRIASDVEGVLSGIPFAVADATGTPAPQPPSRVLPFTLIAGGAVTAVAGAVLLLVVRNQVAAYEKELALGATIPAALKPLGYYQQQSSSLEVQTYLAIGLISTGVLLAALGAVLNVLAVRPSVAVVPGGASAGVSGSLPW